MLKRQRLYVIVQSGNEIRQNVEMETEFDPTSQ